MHSMWQEEQMLDGYYSCGYVVVQEGFKRLAKKLDIPGGKYCFNFCFIMRQYLCRLLKNYKVKLL